MPLYDLLNRTDYDTESSQLMLPMQGQYIFVHDVINDRLQSLGYGPPPPADDVDDDDDDQLYQSELHCAVSDALTLI